MKYVIVAVAVCIIAALGLSWYLQPNDFTACQPGPVAGTVCEKADAIVVISGGDTIARTAAGVELYQNGWAEKIIFSGAAYDKDSPSNAATMRQYAIEQGVPSGAIAIDERAETTQQNAQNVSSIFDQEGYDNIILVTSGYHQRRAALEFQHSLKSAVTIRNHPVADRDWGWWWWLTPRGWWLAIGESLKVIGFYTGLSS